MPRSRSAAASFVHADPEQRLKDVVVLPSLQEVRGHPGAGLAGRQADGVRQPQLELRGRGEQSLLGPVVAHHHRRVDPGAEAIARMVARSYPSAANRSRAAVRIAARVASERRGRAATVMPTTVGQHLLTSRFPWNYCCQQPLANDRWYVAGPDRKEDHVPGRRSRRGRAHRAPARRRPRRRGRPGHRARAAAGARVQPDPGLRRARPHAGAARRPRPRRRPDRHRGARVERLRLSATAPGRPRGAARPASRSS